MSGKFGAIVPARRRSGRGATGTSNAGNTGTSNAGNTGTTGVGGETD